MTPLGSGPRVAAQGASCADEDGTEAGAGAEADRAGIGRPPGDLPETCRRPPGMALGIASRGERGPGGPSRDGAAGRGSCRLPAPDRGNAGRRKARVDRRHESLAASPEPCGSFGGSVRLRPGDPGTSGGFCPVRPRTPTLSSPAIPGFAGPKIVAEGAALSWSCQGSTGVWRGRASGERVGPKPNPLLRRTGLPSPRVASPRGRRRRSRLPPRNASRQRPQ